MRWGHPVWCGPVRAEAWPDISVHLDENGAQLLQTAG